MIKIVFLTVAAMPQICQEQIKPEVWHPFEEQQQQAKTGTVMKSEDSPDSPVTAIAVADPLRATLGAVAVMALRAVGTPRGAMVKITQALDGGRVEVTGGGTDVAEDVLAVADAVAGTTKSAELTFDGGALNNAPMTNAVANGTGLSTAINAALAAAKPSFSLQSILQKIEDIVRAQAPADIDALVVVDQDLEKITVLTGTAAAITGAYVAVQAGIGTSDGELTHDATPASEAESEFGE